MFNDGSMTGLVKQNWPKSAKNGGFVAGFRSRCRPGYLAEAGAVTLDRLLLHLTGKYLFKNSRKLTLFDVFSKVNIKYDLHVLVHVSERILL